MIILPAVDLKNGRCVRLLQGSMEKATEYGDPVAMAQKWQELGAKYLHLVDLDAAFSGNAENLDVVKKIVSALHIPVELGGGIRTPQDIKQRLNMGVERVILGTAAVIDAGLVKESARMYPGRIVVGIDTKNGKVAIRGWVEESGYSATEFALMMLDCGVELFIHTDISRDGMLCGPNIEEELAVAKTGAQVIASGGVGNVGHIRAVKEAGLYGVIVGKALYDGTIDIKEALSLQDG
ncbi:MAG: 1-(5-phosphoribosyl)-5-[(5-phosphoribosylamino)methylideneamino]imidazole-4-carboxamide isomerase [Christensenellales bacterium]